MFQRNEQYQRFFKYIYHNLQYINGSTRNIDLSTNNNTTNKRRLFQNGTVFPGCGESLLHSLFLCLNLFLCVNTDKKEEKERVFMMGALKNHRDERV
ncbi:hypothetical protein ACXX4E_11835, partial [Bacillus cereus]